MTAAAVTYVGAQLALLGAARKLEPSTPTYSDVLTGVRSALERDRFGIVAHLFAARADCGSDHCELFALLQDTSSVQANLVARRFESYVKMHMADWAANGDRPTGAAAASVSDPSLPLPATKQPLGKLFLPSSSSIPSVNIMSSEPAATGQLRETATSADAASQAHKPQVEKPQPRQAPAADKGQTRSGPLQIAPTAQ